MKILESRPLSFILVALVYLIVGVIGVVTYVYLPLSFPLNLLIADIIATVVVFIFSLIFRNASTYDPYWSVQPIVITIAFACNYKLSPASILVLIAIIFWGVRLTINWAYTFHSLKHQDWRYSSYKETTGKLYPFVNFFGFHLMPTLIVYTCVVPAVYMIQESQGFNVGSIIFFVVSIAATVIQGVSDCQMHAFRKKRTGTFIRSGLWKYSRHPNYLGEIMMWWGVGLSAICVLPSRWYLFVGALLNTLLFVFISIPLADKHQCRKGGFEQYKSETRMLFPIKRFKKNQETETN